jgi:hypothetical protein
MIVLIAMVFEHRRLPVKMSGLDTFAHWRISALAAANAVRHDSDFEPSNLVIVRVEDLTLVGWALRSDGRNLTDTLSYLHGGSRVSTKARKVYFIINRPHQGKLFSELAIGHLSGFQTNTLYDDGTTVVYKVRRAHGTYLIPPGVVSIKGSSSSLI